MFVIWNDLYQSVDSGEDGTGWPSYDAALAACVEGADMPAFAPEGRGLVFGRAACAKAVSAQLAAEKEAAEYSARRAATLASFAAAPVAVAAPSVDDRKAKMLAGCKVALLAEQAKGKKGDKVEIARLTANINKLENI